MAGNLLSLLLLVFLKLGSSSMEQLLACHWEKARKEICMHAVRCTASLLFSNQVLLPQSHSPSARHASRRGDVSIRGACTTCPMSRIVGQKASENGCRLRHRWWKRESVFLEHFFLLVEWRLWEEGKLILHFGALWSHPDFLLGVDLNSLSQIGSYMKKSMETYFNLPTIPPCAWLCFLILQNRLNWSNTKDQWQS